MVFMECEGEPEFPGSFSPSPSFLPPRRGEERESLGQDRRVAQGGTAMSDKKNRRKWTPKAKLRIVLESLQSEAKLSEICRREGLRPMALT